MFWITGAILTAGTIVFCVFAKGEVQPWALIDSTEEEERELKQARNNTSNSP